MNEMDCFEENIIFMNERKIHRRLLWRLIRFHSHDKYDFLKAKKKKRSTNSRSDCSFCQRKDDRYSCAVHYYMDAKINHNAYSHQPTNQQPYITRRIELRISDFESLDSLWLHESERLLHLFTATQTHTARVASQTFSLFSSGIESTVSHHRNRNFFLFSSPCTQINLPVL